MITKEEFQKWLADPSYKPLIYQDNATTHIYVKVSKNEHFDYLYGQTNYRDGSIRRNQNFEYSGIYCKRNGEVYDAHQKFFHISSQIEFPYGKNRMKEELEETVRGRIEKRVGNDRNNLTIRQLQPDTERRFWDHLTPNFAEWIARRKFLAHEEDDVTRFHSNYAFGEWSENDLLAYILDPNAFAQRQADWYWETQQETMLCQFMENELVKEKLDRIAESEDHPLQRIRAIMDAVKQTGAKTVTVTIEKDGKEFSFKTKASVLCNDPGSCYGRWYIAAKDRAKFREIFGRGVDYHPEEITCISYCGKAIYEAEPFLPQEDETMTMTM